MWSAPEFSRDDVLARCTSCSSKDDILFVAVGINKINSEQFEMITLYHCKRCSLIFEYQNQKVITTIAEKMIFAPAKTITNILPKEDKKPLTLKDRVKNFNLK